MQGTWVPSLVWEDPTRKAAKPIHHNYWACALEHENFNCWSPCVPWRAQQQEKPPQWEACTPQVESSPCSPQLEKSLHINEDPVCQSLSHVRLFDHPWTVAHQAPLSMGFFRQEDQSGLPFPSPGEDPVQPINKIIKKRKTSLLPQIPWKAYSSTTGEPCTPTVHGLFSLR